MSAAPKFKFAMLISSGPKKGQQIEFDSDRVSIGRSADNTISFPEDPKISRRHAVIEVMPDSILINNVSEKNIVKVNDQPIRSLSLNDGDRVVIGSTEFTFKYLKFGVAKKSEDTNLMIVPNSNLAEAQGPGQAIPESPLGFPNKVEAPFAPPQTPPNQANQQWEAPKVKKSKTNFYIMVLAIGGIFAWLLMSDTKKEEDALVLRTHEQIKMDLEKSDARIKDADEKKKPRRSKQFLKAQEAYLKGRRDYQQRKYSRAVQSFQASLSIYPRHQLARQYLRLSKRKFDELVQNHMIQGRKYREKGNFRMCRASFGLVMTMIKDNQKHIYKEARQFHEECSLMLEGSY